MGESCDLLRLDFRSVGAGASRCRAQRFGKVASFADANVLVRLPGMQMRDILSWGLGSKSRCSPLGWVETSWIKLGGGGQFIFCIDGLIPDITTAEGPSLYLVRWQIIYYFHAASCLPLCLLSLNILP